MTSRDSAALLYGRDRELSALTEALAAIRERGEAIVIHGEAGIGKSALLDEARRHAEDSAIAVLSAAGVESEAELPFAGLHSLLRPVLGAIDGLPAPQRAALSAAFGLTEGPAPDIFLIALASLDLLSDLAVDAPLLLIVDDAHWLDDPTREVLAFVARRIELEPIVLLFTVREGLDPRLESTRLHEVSVEPLDDAAAGALLDASAPGLELAVRRRLLEEAAGNPLALVELPHALSDEERGGLLPELLPLTGRLEQAFAARLTEFPSETRTLLLVAALDVGGDLGEILGAASLVEGRPVTLDAFSPAVLRGLIELRSDGLRFRHPLVRSAIHQATSVSQRNLAHAALADTTEERDRRAWHRAAAAVGTDEPAASDLEELAVRAQERGGVGVAVAALRRAADLSEDPGDRARRLLRAAELAFELGQQGSLTALIHEAEVLELTPVANARLRLVQEMADDFRSSADYGSIASLVDLAELADAEGDPHLAVNLLWGAASRCYWSNPDQSMRLSVADTAERIADPEHDPRLPGILAFAAPLERGPAVVEHLRRWGTDDGVRSDGGLARILGGAAHAVGAFELGASFFGTAVLTLRTEGRLGLLARALVLQSRSAIHLGHLDLALTAAEEGGRLASELRDPLFAAGARSALAIIAALRGDQAGTEANAEAAERAALTVKARPVLASALYARALSALGDGNHGAAYDHLHRLFDPRDPAFHPAEASWAIADLAEAAAHAGTTAEARELLGTVELMVGDIRGTRGAVAVTCARALLAEDPDAEEAFRAALDTDLQGWPFEQARLLLAYGAWLRRHRRVTESRTPLRAARETFDAVGAVPWAERARQELRASGETSRSRRPEARDQLTPQELQIAQMAVAGLTNRQIGEKLYLSHRTVGSHLYRIYPKLGITSRNQLVGSLQGVE